MNTCLKLLLTLACLALFLPQLAQADADSILGVDSTTGVAEVLTPLEAAALLGVAAGGLDSQFDVTGGNTITGADESKPLQIRGSGGQSTSGVNIYQHSSGKLVIKCVVSNVEGACNPGVDLNAGTSWQIRNSGGTAIVQVDEVTGKLSATLPYYWDLDLCAINPSDSSLSHVWNKDPLSTAPTLTAKSGTNRSVCVLTFPDSDGDYGVSIRRMLPSGFTGSFDADIWWDTTGTGNARFEIATKCYADDEADDATYNTASIVTAAAGTSGRPNKQTITGITTTGCTADELMTIRFVRNRTEASDTLNAALNVEKIRFKLRSAE